MREVKGSGGRENVKGFETEGGRGKGICEDSDWGEEGFVGGGDLKVRENENVSLM